MPSAISTSNSKKMGPSIEMITCPSEKNLEVWTIALHTFLFHCEENKSSTSIFHVCKLNSE